uniref:Uncharacterized protein n=1 Tax=Micrurus lemniscatus lemniscatus TaxID=129467 RepID=A0A2D4HBW5_MICLE
MFSSSCSSCTTGPIIQPLSICRLITISNETIDFFYLVIILLLVPLKSKTQHQSPKFLKIRQIMSISSRGQIFFSFSVLGYGEEANNVLLSLWKGSHFSFDVEVRQKPLYSWYPSATEFSKLENSVFLCYKELFTILINYNIYVSQICNKGLLYLSCSLVSIFS